LNQSNRATLKRSCASACSGCDVASSVRLGVPTRPAYFGHTPTPVGPGSRAGALPSPAKWSLASGRARWPGHSRRTALAGHTPHARPCRAACSAVGRPAGPGEAPQLLTCATDPPSSRVHAFPRADQAAAPSSARHHCLLVGVPRLPPLLLECKHVPSLHPHPVKPLVHVHCTVKPPARRSRCSSSWRSALPLNSTAGRSSNPSNPRNGTLGEQGPLPRPFSAKSGLPLAGIRPSSPLAAPGPDSNLSSRSKDLSARGKDLFVKPVF
jgi:hypothetical protein